jgi:putative tributyrin esterase
MLESSEENGGKNMALVQATFMSRALARNVTITAIIPAPKVGFPGEPVQKKGPFKTLYLLHGIIGNHADWASSSRIRELAERNDLAVIMPSGDNSFYVDDEKRGNMYGEFIGSDLIEATREIFNLSDKREDTFIAGLSMGGYGAIRNGLKYCENFSHIAALSSALITYNAPDSTEDSPWKFGKRSYYEEVFGDLEKLPESDNDPEGVLKIVKAQGKEIPKIYMACGTEDSLVDLNRRYRDFLLEENVDLTYVEGPGKHDWKFWDTYIEKVIDWLPLK